MQCHHPVVVRLRHAFAFQPRGAKGSADGRWRPAVTRRRGDRPRSRRHSLRIRDAWKGDVPTWAKNKSPGFVDTSLGRFGPVRAQRKSADESTDPRISCGLTSKFKRNNHTRVGTKKDAVDTVSLKLYLLMREGKKRGRTHEPTLG
jgi:hypothetical protein